MKEVIKITAKVMTEEAPFIPEPQPEHVTVAELNNGKETGVYFTVSAYTFDRYYSNNAKFLLKKKHQK